MNGGEKMAALVIGSLFGLFVVFSIGGDIIGYASGSKTSTVPIQSGIQSEVQSGDQSEEQSGDQYYESPRSGNHDYNDTSPRSPSGGKSKSKKNKRGTRGTRVTRVNKRGTRINKRTNK